MARANPSVKDETVLLEGLMAKVTGRWLRYRACSAEGMRFSSALDLPGNNCSINTRLADSKSLTFFEH